MQISADVFITLHNLYVKLPFLNGKDPLFDQPLCKTLKTVESYLVLLKKWSFVDHLATIE